MSNRQPQMPMVAVVLLTTSLLAVVMALGFSLHQTPTYEATVKMLVGQRSTEDTCYRLQRSTEDTCFRLLGLSWGSLQDLTLTVADVAETMPVAKAVVEQVNLPELSAREVLANMTAEPDPGTLFVNISYKDSDPKNAQLIANTIGEVLSEKISEVSPDANGMIITATVWAPATLPKTPVSPDPVRNMLLALVTWGLLSGLLITARASLGNILRLPQKNVSPEYTAGSLEAAKEQELLEALGRSPSGELTAAGAALETSLTVEEADRMLSRLAAKGHLRVRAREASGGVFYSFWQRS